MNNYNLFKSTHDEINNIVLPVNNDSHTTTTFTLFQIGELHKQQYKIEELCTCKTIIITKFKCKSPTNTL